MRASSATAIDRRRPFCYLFVMADNSRGRDIGKLRVYASQEREPATADEAEAAAERKRM